MLAMLTSRRDAFAPVATAPPPPTLGVSHAIHLTDTAPVKTPPYKQSPAKNEYIRKNVELLLKNKLIVPSNSPWSSAVVIVPKADGSLRMCIDYRKVNSKTKKDAYPMPLIEDCLHMCKGAKFLSIIDVQDAYHHVLMDPGSKQITAFATADGLFEWQVMPFGLCNAPATFQRHVDTILRPYIGKTCAAFFDDIVVFTDGTFEQHIKDVEVILGELSRARLSAKIKKCKFGYKEINFVGHIVREGRVLPDPEKIKAVTDWRPPTTVLELQSFIGLVNYYRRFIVDFAIISGPLYALLRKDQEWTWGDLEQAAFERLKTALVSAPCLHAPDFKQPFILQTDASIHGIGAVLTQNIDGEEHPIAYLSRQLNEAEKNYSAVEWECLAAVWSVKKLQAFLADSLFTIVTDASSLKELPTKKFENSRLMRWSMTLAEYNYNVIHRRGRNNANADSLSRAPLVGSAPPEPVIVRPRYVNRVIQHVPFPDADVHHVTVSACNRVVRVNRVSTRSTTRTDARGQPTTSIEQHNAPPTRVERTSEKLKAANERLETQYRLVDSAELQGIVDKQHQDEVLRPMIEYLTDKSTPANFDPTQTRKLKRDSEKFALIDTTTPAGLYYIAHSARGPLAIIRPMLPKLVIPKEYRKTMLAMYHDSPFGGHLGALRTYHKLYVCYYWDSMFDDCQKYVRDCRECHIVKQRLRNPPQPGGLMPAPTEPFEVVSMDTCGPFPLSADFKYVFTFIDHFTRFAIAVPSVNKSSSSLAQAFVNEVIAKYGTPRILISDNGTEFVDRMLDELYKSLKIKRIISAPYHPQSNGLVERVNGTMKQIVNALTVPRPGRRGNEHEWAYSLQLAMHAYNTSIGDFLGMSPFELLFGRPPRSPLNDLNEIMGSAGDQPHMEYVRLMKDRLRLAYEWVKTVLSDKRQEVMEQNIALGDHPVYKRDDIVYTRRLTGPYLKQHRWDVDKPYVVTGRKGPSAYILHPYSLATKSLVKGKVITRNAVDIAYLGGITPQESATWHRTPIQIAEVPDPMSDEPAVKAKVGRAAAQPSKRKRAATNTDSIGHLVHESRRGQFQPIMNDEFIAKQPDLEYQKLYSLPSRQASESVERRTSAKEQKDAGVAVKKKNKKKKK